MIINCNGIKSVGKQAVFRATIDQYQPDIVLGCESKLSGNIATYDVFPENYTVCRKDRSENGGGVFIATKDSLITQSEPSLDSDCEIVWNSIQFTNSKPLYIASYYKPKNSWPNGKYVLIH